MFDFLPSEAHFSKIFGLSRKLKNQVSALISQRIELQSMLRCLNDRINEPDIFYYRFWKIGAIFRYVCRTKAHFQKSAK